MEQFEKMKGKSYLYKGKEITIEGFEFDEKEAKWIIKTDKKQLKTADVSAFIKYCREIALPQEKSQRGISVKIPDKELYLIEYIAAIGMAMGGLDTSKTIKRTLSLIHDNLPSLQRIRNNTGESFEEILKRITRRESEPRRHLWSKLISKIKFFKVG